jgi:flavodoxin
MLPLFTGGVKEMRKLLLFVPILFCAGASMELNAQTQSGGKILVAYFSWSGNAKALAGQIARETGGDLFEIKTVRAYPDTYNECITVAKQEQETNARPALSGAVSNMAQYGTVFLCYPNWWGTLPMGVFTFLEAYDFSGKTVYPLITHGGSRFGRSLDDIKKLCPQAVLGEGIDISAFDTNPKDAARVTTPNGNVTAWVRRTGTAK